MRCTGERSGIWGGTEEGVMKNVGESRDLVVVVVGSRVDMTLA